MTETLSSRLTQQVKSDQQSHSSYNRALFLSLRSDITQALNDGWSVKSIWQLLTQEGKITFSYQAFLGYVRRLITSVKMNPSPLLPSDPDVVPSLTPTVTMTPRVTPRRDLKKEDLF